MPVRRRVAKRKISEAAEREAWFCVFDCGYDFMQDLEPIGIFVNKIDAADKAAWDAAADAWHRFGRQFMETSWWKPTKHRPKPWALEQFGEP